MRSLRNLLTRIFRKNDSGLRLEDIPDSYYVGQDYVEDEEKVAIEIHLEFFSPGEISETNLKVGGKIIFLKQNGSVFRVMFEEVLSKKLLTNIKNEHKGDKWILGYVAEIMPYVNQEILKQRYLSGHFLIRTYSQMDIMHLWLVDKTSEQKIDVAWPGSLTSFSEIVKLAPKFDRVYLRDLIDSMHAFFNGNYEECIRKSITSIETFIKWYGITSEKLPGKKMFESIVRKHLTDIRCPLMRENSADIIMEAYFVRNAIVHDGKRLDPIEGRQLGKRVTHMVNEVYKNYGVEDELKRYALFLEMQFMMQENYLGQDGLTLQWLEKIELRKS